MNQATSSKQASGGGLFVLLFLLPVLLLVLVLGVIGFLAAKHGARYRFVKWVMFPAAWCVTNFISLATLLIVLLVYGVLKDPSPGSWVFSHSLDLLGFWLWGPIVGLFWSFNDVQYSLSMSGWGWLAYQLLIYGLFGWRITRTIGLAVFEAGLISRANGLGVAAVSLHQQQLATDAAYAKATVQDRK